MCDHLDLQKSLVVATIGHLMNILEETFTALQIFGPCNNNLLYGSVHSTQFRGLILNTARIIP